ncbi:hypothetical protein JB92DRAFT_334535 [Gautieria morchelliformis]|nr:hypothetical protein JB92DRAFT_334535 [Gautieria morchelliformis]
MHLASIWSLAALCLRAYCSTCNFNMHTMHSLVDVPIMPYYLVPSMQIRQIKRNFHAYTPSSLSNVQDVAYGEELSCRLVHQSSP